MLQWTRRFRDMLERGGWLTDTRVSKQLTFIREAEFVGTNGSFPDDFRWEAFQNCCYNKRRFPAPLRCTPISLTFLGQLCGIYAM
jgi:hypothetical protein